MREGRGALDEGKVLEKKGGCGMIEGGAGAIQVTIGLGARKQGHRCLKRE